MRLESLVFVLSVATLACGPSESEDLIGTEPALGDEVDVGSVEDEGLDDETPTSESGAQKRVRLHPGETKNAELVKKLPVGKTASGAKRRVVMRLGPSEIPDLAFGDTIMAAAEVQVTTQCDVGQIGPGCGYNPKIRGQLILTGNPDDVDPSGAGSKALTDPQTISCTKAEHHCMMVFRPGASKHDLVGGFDLPCVADSSCHINLVMWAWHPDSRSGGVDEVLVGENDGNYLQNGQIGGDKGRLMVIREHGLVADDRKRREESGGGAITVPTSTEPKLIYSLKLRDGDLKRHEQYLVEALLVTEVEGRARFSTMMFLTKDPKATSGNGLDKTFPGSISEHNGINCTPGTSPCKTRKVAVFRVTDDIQGPVYVNIIAKSAVPGGGSTKVTVKRGEGWLRSTRYRASLHD